MDEDPLPFDPELEGLIQPEDEDTIQPPQEDFFVDTEEIQSFDDLETMGPPPSRRSSTTLTSDDSEEVKHPQSSWRLSDFELTLGMLCKRFEVPGKFYQCLLETLELLENVEPIRLLSRSLITLKRHSREHLPLIEKRRQEIELISEKLPTHRVATHSVTSAEILGLSVPKEMMYWFNPVRWMLSSTLIRKMHFGMAHFVDEPGEFWHEYAWGSSIRAWSGEFAQYSDNPPIFPSDIVAYRSQNPNCGCSVAGNTHLARITCIG